MRLNCHLFYHGKYRKGTVYLDNDKILDFEENNAEPEYVLIEGFVNAHTHIGDSFVREVPRLGHMELVGPGGFKHRMLENADGREIISGMRRSVKIMEKEHQRAFFDFRESGWKGIELMRKIKYRGIEPVVLSRPSTDEYDERELNLILENSSGIGLSSISDYSYDFIKRVAAKTKEKGKIFSIHASERVREDMEMVLSLKPDFLVHLYKATDEDLKIVAEKNIPVVLTPRSSLFFNTFIDFSKYRRNGVTIALGTDNGMISIPSIRQEMSFAYYLGLDPLEVIAASTLPMDRFLGRAKELYLFRSRPGEIAKNPMLGHVKKLYMEDTISEL